VGTKTTTMYVSDLDQSEIPAEQAYQLSIRHPDGSMQQLDISEKKLPGPEVGGCGQDAEEAWAQARARHQRGRRPT
jgi:hypothetical protein